MIIFSVLFIYLGVERTRTIHIIIGLWFALCGILTRQIGLVIPFGFIATCMVHPKGKDLGRVKILFMAAGITVLPWMAYEFYLSLTGSTPFNQHQVIHKIIRYPITKGFPGYPIYLSSQLLIALGYVSFLVSPVLLLKYDQYLRWRYFRPFLISLTAAFILFETALFTGLVDPPVVLYRNVVFNFGIGPILLKDTYIMGIQRTASISKPFFYLIIYWAVLTAVVVTGFGASSLRRLLKAGPGHAENPSSFLSSFSLLTALAYVGIILLTGFHDRYLIPVCMLIILFLISDKQAHEYILLRSVKSYPALVPLLFFTVLSVCGVRDFMEMKRSLKKAQNHLLMELKVDPCQIDGGFEFNGYHCYQKDFVPRKGLSWWWVKKENYLVTLGPIPGYRVVKTFPFNRYLGPDGAIHIIQSVRKSG